MVQCFLLYTMLLTKFGHNVASGQDNPKEPDRYQIRLGCTTVRAVVLGRHGVLPYCHCMMRRQ